ncbi:ATP phosphoribosyltransferase [Maridesulfovibrio salexigens]|uniref:ATP phosphoribosyltransferase n=1 Tax=Maridesulfovibrio salexigens (strain ATCC 14822 / DSM 2638 / NCIMB 8403 / VKM B-1763) TaxID=526222 RepID=C6BUP6_MARSD|nr:ATP phosphoribosyltransferase [Maridesulfovibrio salexigens]ACS81840.1 ATP phosphoribosyltransferase [Maridesulfovibrio salexigens DSM 2638]
MSNQLKIGLPKGSLQDSTIKLFAKSGWKINLHHRNYFPDVNDDELNISMCRVQEISRYIEDGILDCGLAGRDWVLENKSDVVEISSLVYSKVSNRPARWILAVAGDSPYRTPEDLAGKKIATELLGATKEYFESKNIDVDVFYSWGATEAKVVEGLCDAIVEVTETGTTIKAHGLRVIDEVMSTNTVFIVNKDAWNDPWKRKKIENINLLLQGALRAEKMVGLKMNMPKASLEKAMKVMPSLNSPTVSDLSDPEWVSVEIMVEEVVVRELIPELIDMGAEGIIEYPLNKVI